MKNKNPGNPQVTPQTDETFDPWEQTRPIPLFVIAVLFALAIWGLLTYVSEYWAQRRVHADQAGAAGPVPTATRGAELFAATGTESADSATLQLVSAGRGPAWSCASCHGEAGQGNLNTPRLAGQQAGYLKKQLQDFASGARRDDSMAFVARALSEADMDKVARYYAGIDLRMRKVPTLGGDLARGKLLAEQGDWKNNVPPCFSCHGMDGEGVAPGFPALAGQKPDYLFAQLAAWHAGERRNSPQKLMDGIARRMHPDDMRAVSDYLGSLPPQPVAAVAHAGHAGPSLQR